MTSLKLAFPSVKALLVDAIVHEEGVSAELALRGFLVGVGCHLPFEITGLIVKKLRSMRHQSYMESYF